MKPLVPACLGALAAVVPLLLTGYPQSVALGLIVGAAYVAGGAK